MLRTWRHVPSILVWMGLANFASPIIVRAGPGDVGKVTYLVGDQRLEWQAGDGKPQHYAIEFPTRLMTVGDESRQFSKEEATTVGEALGELVALIAQKVIPPGLPPIVSIQWDASQETISILTDNEKEQHWVVNNDGDLYEGDRLERQLPFKVALKLFRYSAAVLQYCRESIVWWQEGRGEPTGKRRRRAGGEGGP